MSGAKVDQGTVDLAFDTAYNKKQYDIYGAEQASKARQDEINKAFLGASEGKTGAELEGL